MHKLRGLMTTYSPKPLEQKEYASRLAVSLLQYPATILLTEQTNYFQLRGISPTVVWHDQSKVAFALTIHVRGSNVLGMPSRLTRAATPKESRGARPSY